MGYELISVKDAPTRIPLDEKLQAKHVSIRPHASDTSYLVSAGKDREGIVCIWFEDDYQTKIDLKILRCLLGYKENLTDKFIKKTKEQYLVRWFPNQDPVERASWYHLISCIQETSVA